MVVYSEFSHTKSRKTGLDIQWQVLAASAVHHVNMEGYPKKDHSKWNILLKLVILVYPYFRKPPCLYMINFHKFRDCQVLANLPLLQMRRHLISWSLNSMRLWTAGCTVSTKCVCTFTHLHSSFMSPCLLSIMTQTHMACFRVLGFNIFCKILLLIFMFGQLVALNMCLVGGYNHFLFSHILGIIIPLDYHIFRWVETTNQVST